MTFLVLIVKSMPCKLPIQFKQPKLCSCLLASYTVLAGAHSSENTVPVPWPSLGKIFCLVVMYRVSGLLCVRLVCGLVDETVVIAGVWALLTTSRWQ